MAKIHPMPMPVYMTPRRLPQETIPMTPRKPARGARQDQVYTINDFARLSSNSSNLSNLSDLSNSSNLSDLSDSSDNSIPGMVVETPKKRRQRPPTPYPPVFAPMATPRANTPVDEIDILMLTSDGQNMLIESATSGRQPLARRSSVRRKLHFTAAMKRLANQFRPNNAKKIYPH